jgi:cyclic beta-1,2-glucan glucanotransferase
MEGHAQSLAEAQKITEHPSAGRPVATRLHDNARVLTAAYRRIASVSRIERPITPAAEWLLDNFHVVEEQIREITTDLPPHYYRELPKLSEGHLEGYPRVFGIAWAFIAHTDSRIDFHMLVRFVSAYQRVQPLTIGELWAIAITLRITLVENLRRLAQAIVRGRDASQLADAAADRLLGVGNMDPEPVGAVLGAYEDAPLPPAFAAQLDHRLRDQDAFVTPALTWLSERLAAQGTSADHIIQEELREQGALNVTVRNVITSMRTISNIDWSEFFEEVSLVDAALREESEFEAMDFATRDLYRRAIERLARGSRLSELDVAKRAVACALQVAKKSPSGRQSDREREPGYYLIARGRKRFEKEIGYRTSLVEWPGRINAATRGGAYLGFLALATAIIAALPFYWLAQKPLPGWVPYSLMLLAILPASDAAVALVHRVITNRIGPAILPGMELIQGVPAHLRTLVTMPVLLTAKADVEELIERLELHHLASAGGELYFALLSDWTDAPAESAADDAMLLDTARQRIAELNRRYSGGEAGERFLLLHRRRLWNPGEGVWMGWERKRGKLHELNRLLRGAADTTFIGEPGKPPRAPDGVRYVITLDADTRVPRETVKRLVGKMAHPLNAPRLDPKTCRVVEGHAILQPRVTPSLPIGREGSLFQRVFSAPRGLDPYAFAVSDVYQDLFEEGSYTGKGIYEIDSFEAALDGRIAENSILSHDLLEGSFASAGLVSDIEVVEEFPTRYDVAAARQHRWVRGDWQLLPWIFGYGRDPRKRKRNIICLIGRWKMVDNLRRSLSAPATLLALIAGWLLPPRAAEIWTGFILLTIVLPPLLPLLSDLAPRRKDIALIGHLRGLGSDFAITAIQIGFLITFLMHQGGLMLDAILRTLFRLCRRKRLLEWVTAHQVRSSAPNGRRHLAGKFAASIGATFAILALLAAFHTRTEAVAAPFLALWAFSPFIAYWASRSPPTVGHLPVAEEDAQALRAIARRTWRFFEVFITEADNALPPDNFQEDPKPIVARRTSPTNIGLYLLTIVTARDFGWLGTLDAVERLEAAMKTIGRLERYRGHLYNWYATEDLRPLHPKYISTVDSGNLAGHLVVLSRACHSMAKAPLAVGQRLAGIRDTLAVARESLDALSGRQQDTHAESKRLATTLDAIEARLLTAAEELRRALPELAKLTDAAAAGARRLLEELGPVADEVLFWLNALAIAVRSHLRDLQLVAQEASPHPKPVQSLAPAVSVVRARVVNASQHGDVETLERPSARHEPASSYKPAASLALRLTAIADMADSLFADMNFDFLYEPERQLFSIGYRVEDSALDPNCYDLLASEARLASFIAIAREEAPTKHWFRLGRTLAPIGHGAALISWSGSMFEYLMPSLVMRAAAGSILDQTNRLAVRRQIDYGRRLDVPWGVSESLFNARDIENTYQYSGFGVPDLGFKRGLGDNIVIAPYATALAAMIEPKAAVENFRHLTNEGGRGAFGWYEALDYTPARVPEGAKAGIVKAYMAHHQAMSIVAIGDALMGGHMREYFHSAPIIQANELLLQERMPRDIVLAKPPGQKVRGVLKAELVSPEIQRRFRSPHSRIPRTHLLSNGSYTVMLTGAGSGYSAWRDLDVTRWREDVTCDDSGSYIYLRDVRSGDVWSAGYQPAGIEPDTYEVAYSESRAEFTRQDGTLRTVLDVSVSPEHDGEVRRVTLTNLGTRTREVELTSYVELALASRAEDAAHPAFSKLFIQTEFIADAGVLLATRRRKSSSQPEVWAAHLTAVEGDSAGNLQFETDRARFLGRGQTVRTPGCVLEGWPLSNTVGCVLDPVFSLRRRVRIGRGESVRVSFWTLLANTREEALDLADKHSEPTAFDRIATMSWTLAQGQFHHLGIGPEEAHLFQRLANRVLYSDATLRPSSAALKAGGRNVSALWAQGISGDHPIVLLRIDQVEDIDIVRQLLRAYEYWRMKRLQVDLVILNERASSYMQDLQGTIDHMIRTTQSRIHADDGVHGNIFVLRTDLVPPDIVALLQTAARAVLFSRRGTLAEQISRIEEAKPPVLVLPARVIPTASIVPPPPRPQLQYFNGIGGFTDGGREYVTILEQGHTTPAPWINVVANDAFGFQVSADGAGFTWALNSQQNRLTAWSNDPVSDPPGEAFYLRDEDSGELWSPTALPIREKNTAYIARHGQGYSRFECRSHGMALELLQYVPLKDPVKISRLKLTNESRRARRISVTAYVEWVLGQSRARSAPGIVTEIDKETGAMFARNPLSNDFGTRVAFTDLDGRQDSWTGDRTEFLGRNGTLQKPVALLRGTAFSNRTGAGLDPCSALQTTVKLKPGASIDVVFLIGEAANAKDAQALVGRYRTSDLNAVLNGVTGFWDKLLSKIEVKTPDPALDLVTNRWLLYQTLVCRVWARSAFYQSSGAYGFRDQLQDTIALAASTPEIARTHLLRAASRQFAEGDVQHWWLPETGTGVRTRVSDDRIWLAYCAAQYVGISGDDAVLDAAVPFIEGPPLQEGQYDAFFLPPVSQTTASLFEHCARGLDGALATGAHGLPLMGTGDWNDGMNHVGAEGKGESVWLGWFQYATLNAFARLAERRDPVRATNWREHALRLKDSLEQSWDGDWYRRAYFDDGTPIGSVANTECRIDSIAQSWSVISGAGDTVRAARAMAAMEKYLMKRDDALVLLFTPPFDKALPDPGYIRGYPLGIRENGGQYTHAALWAALAFAMLGDGDKTHELLAMLNPVSHAGNSAAVHRYKVEPYAVCADIYSVTPHVGRGGWTWYTGSAGWMHRVAMEGMLGLKMEGSTLVIDPCIPRGWPGYSARIRHDGALYELSVENPRGAGRGVASVEIDGRKIEGAARIALADDGATHKVRVVLG